MGLGLGIKATLLQETNHVPRYVVFSLTERAGHIVLDDVIKVVVTQPVKRLIFVGDRYGRGDNHLPLHGHAVYIQTFYSHLIHQGWDVLH